MYSQGMTTTRTAAQLAHTRMVRRIVRAFRAASADDLARGLGWYAQAYRESVRIDPLNPARAAGVIAALSPRNQWSNNVKQAAAVIACADAGLPCPVLGLGANTRTAWEIATGTEPLDALGTLSRTGRVMSGMKVRSFFLNIMGDTDSVTCDVWAAKVATGHASEALVKSPRGYATVVAAFQAAAKILGVTPREVQAATWTAVRGVKPTDAGFHAAALALAS